VVTILTINYGVPGAVSIDANARHLNDVAYTAFTHIKVPKSMVSILTSSKSRYHELCFCGSHAYHAPGPVWTGARNLAPTEIFFSLSSYFPLIAFVLLNPSVLPHVTYVPY
jgi:hypothetical protein